MMKNGIDPRLTTIFGVWTSILLMIAGIGPVFFDGALPVAIATMVVRWCSIFGAINSVVLTGGAMYSSPKAGPMVGIPMPSPAAVAKAILVALAVTALVGVTPASAAPLKKFTPAVTGNIAADVQADAAQIFPKANMGVVKNPDGTISCSFNVFADLNPTNLADTMKACISQAGNTFAADIDAALASAEAYSGNQGDQPAVQCLKPGSAIVHAAIPVAAVIAQAGVPAVPAVPATATSPAVPAQPAVPAVVAVPAYNPGPMILFQKYREFVLAGGLSACQQWVQSVVNATVTQAASNVGGVVAVGAAAVSTGAVAIP